MKRFVGFGSVFVLLLLTTQVVYGQYEPIGPVAVSDSTPTAGGSVGVSGSGYAPGSEVRITIESRSALLATVTADATGAFVATVTIPAALSGTHTIKSTGIAPDGSVRVLATVVTVSAPGLPATDESLPTLPSPGNADVWIVFLIAAAGVLLVSLSVLWVLRRAATR